MIWVIISLLGFAVLFGLIVVVGGWVILLQTFLCVLAILAFAGFIYACVRAMEYLSDKFDI